MFTRSFPNPFPFRSIRPSTAASRKHFTMVARGRGHTGKEDRAPWSPCPSQGHARASLFHTPVPRAGGLDSFIPASCRSPGAPGLCPTSRRPKPAPVSGESHGQDSRVARKWRPVASSCTDSLLGRRGAWSRPPSDVVWPCGKDSEHRDPELARRPAESSFVSCD